MLKWAQKSINVLGFGAGVGCLSYGAYALKESSPQTLGIMTVTVGAILTVQSCCMCTMNIYGERQVQRILGELEKQNEALRTSVGNMNLLIDQHKIENTRQKAIVDEAQLNMEVLAERTEELSNSAKRLKELNHSYQTQLQENRILSERMEAEINTLETNNHESQAQIDELQTLVVEQKEQIANLAEQAKHLNELQRQSVDMIQKLALYGNDCKKFGLELSDVTKELRETDESLGLTAGEMATQTRALHNIIQALERTDRSLRVHSSSNKRKKKKTTAVEMV